MKLKTIWEEIFINAGYTVTGGEVLNQPVFDRLYMPISSLKTSDTTKYLYSVYWSGSNTITLPQVLAFPGASIIKGDAVFAAGYFIAPYTAQYKFRVSNVGFVIPAGDLWLCRGLLSVGVATFEATAIYLMGIGAEYEVEYDATAGDILSVVTAGIGTYLYYSVQL